MKFLVWRHAYTTIKWFPRGTVRRITQAVLEPVGEVRAVSFDHARAKALKAYPEVEPELLRVTIP